MVGSGQLGLRQLGTTHYDVIFCDMMMPTMDGLEFARLASEAAGSLLPPMILVTSARLSGEKEHALEAGYRHVLFKPVRQRDMFRSLTSVLEPGVPVEPAPPEGDRFILVAEDNPINARLTTLILSRFGFQAHIAGNGREVIERLRGRQGYEAILASDRETCLRAGMNGYLPKPLRPADVEYALAEMGLVSR